MKTFVTHKLDGIDSLELQDKPAPGPLGGGQIRIAMRAASINYRDTMAVSGAFGPAGPQGLIPCSDGAGEVIEIAPDVTRVKTGNRVALVGLLTGWPNTTSSIFASGVDVNPIKVGSRYDFEMMNRAIGYHEMHPVIDSRYPFDQLREALHHLKSGKHFGKIVITF